jgi:hypothetical protein
MTPFRSFPVTSSPRQDAPSRRGRDGRAPAPRRARGREVSSAGRYDDELRVPCRRMKLAHCRARTFPWMWPQDSCYVSFEYRRLRPGKRPFPSNDRNISQRLEAKGFGNLQRKKLAETRRGTLRPSCQPRRRDHIRLGGVAPSVSVIRVGNRADNDVRPNIIFWPMVCTSRSKAVRCRGTISIYETLMMWP